MTVLVYIHDESRLCVNDANQVFRHYRRNNNRNNNRTNNLVLSAPLKSWLFIQPAFFVSAFLIYSKDHFGEIYSMAGSLEARKSFVAKRFDIRRF